MNKNTTPKIEYKYFDWNKIIERLKYHRKRLKLNQEEVKKLIRQKYQCGFIKLPDEKIIELGLTFKACQTKEDFYKMMQQ